IVTCDANGPRETPAHALSLGTDDCITPVACCVQEDALTPYAAATANDFLTSVVFALRPAARFDATDGNRTGELSILFDAYGAAASFRTSRIGGAGLPWDDYRFDFRAVDKLGGDRVRLLFRNTTGSAPTAGDVGARLDDLNLVAYVSEGPKTPPSTPALVIP